MTASDKETILVIDDSPMNLEILSSTLTRFGYTVQLAKDGSSGIQQANCSQPDLILLDVIMPGIDGFETCRQLQQQPSTQDIPIIFMTALADSSDKVRGLSLGAVDYITKPFQDAEILARIQVHLKLRRLNLELAQQKQQLEQRVRERTAELSQAIADLKKAQLQLVQAEKISSLGQLVAGVAHEVNNPVGFISGNLHYATQHVEDLIRLVTLYQKTFPQPGQAIEAALRTIDLEYLVHDLPKMVSSMKLGIDRIRDIMQSLRTFSRRDGLNKTAVDIHDGIESTLMILQHRLRAQADRPAIQVVKEYGQFPNVECYAGQLNQVFMNLLSNAIDALEESRQGKSYTDLKDRPQIIRISTDLVEKPETEIAADSVRCSLGPWVVIQIADNGTGVTEALQQQIFDPFFTTKPIGKGTGLGLSISHQIITEQHSGSLHCISTPGEGTEFVIQIPLTCPN